MGREEKMWQMQPGEQARVTKIETKGEMRRRFLDIGLVEHTRVKCVGQSPLGDPKAFQIRGAVMAIRKKESSEIYVETEHRKYCVGLAGNPNVGKSTVFNGLTGMKQHTGNWPGKTVENARGSVRYRGGEYEFVDIPGCYSLMAHSEEEMTARDFLCFDRPDAVVVVCDATCLERNLNLVLQIMEAVPKVLVCVNLMDEAEKKKIEIDLQKLGELLQTRVVGTAARSKRGLFDILENLRKMLEEERKSDFEISYGTITDEKIKKLEEEGEKYIPDSLKRRWVCARLLEGEERICRSIKEWMCLQTDEFRKLMVEAEKFREELSAEVGKDWKDEMASATVHRAEKISKQVIRKSQGCHRKDRKLDRLFTGRVSGFLIMILLLLGIFWITIAGANVPSEFLSTWLFRLEDFLWKHLAGVLLPVKVCDFLIHGIYRTVVWVVSVMLPPMAIFFPLFTLLEDFGYLPRVAFNLDKCFQKCCACGKQALTMMMGFGCNAVGVMGCRIIDSPRERMIAVLTNCMVPCNGRFPILIALITMFFLGAGAGAFSQGLSAVLLTMVILFGILMTLAASALLSKTILRGTPSAFTLELPPYRRPQVGKVILRSILDRTLFVLGRAVTAAIPAGILLWILANISWEGVTLLHHLSQALQPFASLLGLDGVILLAFILGFPANEIVVPIMIMAYMAQGKLTDIQDLQVLKSLLLANGWTWKTAVCTVMFSLLHWPCATTCITIWKETRKIRWVLTGILLPTGLGMVCCWLIHFIP